MRTSPWLVGSLGLLLAGWQPSHAQARAMPAQPTPIDAAEFVELARRAGPSIASACLASGERARVSLRFAPGASRLFDAGRLTTRVLGRVTPRTRGCIQGAAARFLPLHFRRPVRPLTAVVSLGAPTPPSPPTYDAAAVRLELDRRRASLWACLPGVPPGTSDRLSLHLRVDPSGAVTLVGATLPAGQAGGPALSCLAAVVQSLRVAAPPAPRDVRHELSR